MSVERGVTGYAIAILGIILILGAVIIALSVLTKEPVVKPILAKSIDLRNATDPVKKAKLITELDSLIAGTKNENVISQWQRMTECLSSKCPDEAYFDLVLITLAEYEDIAQSELLVNVLAVNKYWGNNDQLLEFSKSLSAATDQVSELKSKNAKKIWDQIVACNGVCAQKNDLFFEFIKAAV